MNKGQMGNLEARRNSIDELMATSMVPGFHSDYPLQNVALQSALRKKVAEKVAQQESIDSEEPENSQDEENNQLLGDEQNSEVD